VPTPTTTASQTPSPLPTVTPPISTPTTTPTATKSLATLFGWQPLPELVWSEELQIVAVIDEAANVSWSPVANEFVSSSCIGPLGYTAIVKLLWASAPDFAPLNITPDEEAVNGMCNNSYGLTWTPDGQQIVFTGGNETPSLFYGNLWIINLNDQDAHIINPEETRPIWMPSPQAWLDDRTLFYSEYGGGGTLIGHFINIQTGQPERLIDRIAGGYGPFSNDFIALYSFSPEQSYEEAAGVIPLINEYPTPPNVEQWITFFDTQLNLYLLSFDYGSRFQDWLPGTNAMLVTTWEQKFSLNYTTNTNLQLWRVDEGEIVMLVPKGRHGNFSPDGRYLSYLLPII
jgi:hypothetical protein